MKVVLAMVMSVDGRTTKWGNPNIYEWTSKEDQKYFFSLIGKHKAIIMGRKTFDAARSVMRLSSGKLRIVLTKNPKKYADTAVPGQLEFTDDSPKDIIKKLKKRGFREALLLGGGEINSLFFKEKLVDEVWITVEPLIFGSGNGLAEKNALNVIMKLKSIKMLNEQGTILLKYQVL